MTDPRKTPVSLDVHAYVEILIELNELALEVRIKIALMDIFSAFIENLPYVVDEGYFLLFIKIN